MVNKQKSYAVGKNSYPTQIASDITIYSLRNVRVTHTKDARIMMLGNLTADCKGPRIASYKGCPECKKQAFRQHVVNKQKSYAAAIGKNSYPTQIASDITIYSWATDKKL